MQVCGLHAAPGGKALDITLKVTDPRHQQIQIEVPYILHSSPDCADLHLQSVQSGDRILHINSLQSEFGNNALKQSDDPIFSVLHTAQPGFHCESQKGHALAKG